MKKNNLIAAVVLIFLMASSSLNAQKCTNAALFKKGAELLYHTYLPKQALLSSKVKFNETTQITFTVTDVVDSAGVTYSHIIKKGVSAENNKNWYEKKYILSCKDGKVYFPADFYNVDTVYLGDIYPAMKNRGFYSATNLQGTAMQYFSTDAAEGDFGFIDKKMTVTAVLRDFGFGEYNSKGGISNSPSDGLMHSETSASIATNEFLMSTEIKTVNKKGSTKIEAANQRYNAVKIEIESVATIKSHYRSQKNSPVPDMSGISRNEKLTLFYNEEIGIIKTEGDKTHGYFELYKLTLPK